jgi:hypothetical protein
MDMMVEVGLLSEGVWLLEEDGVAAAAGFEELPKLAAVLGEL